MTYQRIMLKLSGEMFGGARGIGVDPDVVANLAGQIKAVVDAGVQVAVAATSSGAPSSPSAAWPATGPTTWACWAP